MGIHNFAKYAKSFVNSNGHSKNGQSSMASMPHVELPPGFVLLCAIPEHMGGGWMCEVPVKLLVKMTPQWNPTGRTDENDGRSYLRSLYKSVSDHGLNQFPVVNRKDAVEGNRRIRVARMLGWQTMVVLYRPWANASTYAEVNHEQRRHKVRQQVESWLIEPAAVTHSMNRRLMRASVLVGMDTIEWVTNKKRLNILSLLSWAERAYKYARPSVKRERFLRKAVRHMARFDGQKRVRDWIEVLKGSPVVLVERIMAGKPLCC